MEGPSGHALQAAGGGGGGSQGGSKGTAARRRTVKAVAGGDWTQEASVAFFIMKLSLTFFLTLYFAWINLNIFGYFIVLVAITC